MEFRLILILLFVSSIFDNFLFIGLISSLDLTELIRLLVYDLYFNDFSKLSISFLFLFIVSDYIRLS